jgi:acyl-coenzyme A synthetase/AMP-(fatty) acid ligase
MESICLLKKTDSVTQLLIPDGRVTEVGLKNLVESTECKAWISAEDDSRGPLLRTDSGLQMCALPSLQWALSNEEQERYPYDKTWKQAAHDVIAVIHTSGTTGTTRKIPAG